MKAKKHSSNLLYSMVLSMVACFGLYACEGAKNTDEHCDTSAATSTDNLDSQSNSGTVWGPFEGEPLPESEYSKHYDERMAEEEQLKAKNAKQTAASATTQSASSAGRTERLYVSTYGANGQVWGHVTMHGNSGSGTIHDADENTLSVKVTRHGNELFGTDQNGRQYVFKI